MSEFAFMRFPCMSLLTEEEEILESTEQVLDTEGIECISKIKIIEEKLKEILQEVRKIQKNCDGYKKAINMDKVNE